VPSVVNALLDDWLGKLQPYHDKWKAGASGTLLRVPDRALRRRRRGPADQVTDARAAKSEHGTVKKLYEKNRGTAKKNVVEADARPRQAHRQAPDRRRRDPAGVTLPATA
jgi:hypothetical protein